MATREMTQAEVIAAVAEELGWSFVYTRRMRRDSAALGAATRLGFDPAILLGPSPEVNEKAVEAVAAHRCQAAAKSIGDQPGPLFREMLEAETREFLGVALPAFEAAWREQLLSDEAIEAAARRVDFAAFRDWVPPGCGGPWHGQSHSFLSSCSCGSTRWETQEGGEEKLYRRRERAIEQAVHALQAALDTTTEGDTDA